MHCHCIRKFDFKIRESTPIPSAVTTIRSDDPAWAHGYIDPANNKQVICRYCEKVIEDDAEAEVKIFTNPTTLTTTSKKGKEKQVPQTSTQNKKKSSTKNHRRVVSNTPQPPMSKFFAPRMTLESQPAIKWH